MEPKMKDGELQQVNKKTQQTLASDSSAITDDASGRRNTLADFSVAAASLDIASRMGSNQSMTFLTVTETKVTQAGTETKTTKSVQISTNEETAHKGPSSSPLFVQQAAQHPMIGIFGFLAPVLAMLVMLVVAAILIVFFSLRRDVTAVVNTIASPITLTISHLVGRFLGGGVTSNGPEPDSFSFAGKVGTLKNATVVLFPVQNSSAGIIWPVEVAAYGQNYWNITNNPTPGGSEEVAQRPLEDIADQMKAWFDTMMNVGTAWDDGMAGEWDRWVRWVDDRTSDPVSARLDRAYARYTREKQAAAENSWLPLQWMANAAAWVAPHRYGPRSRLESAERDSLKLLLRRANRLEQDCLRPSIGWQDMFRVNHLLVNKKGKTNLTKILQDTSKYVCGSYNRWNVEHTRLGADGLFQRGTGIAASSTFVADTTATLDVACIFVSLVQTHVHVLSADLPAILIYTEEYAKHFFDLILYPLADHKADLDKSGPSRPDRVTVKAFLLGIEQKMDNFVIARIKWLARKGYLEGVTEEEVHRAFSLEH